MQTGLSLYLSVGFNENSLKFECLRKLGKTKINSPQVYALPGPGICWT